MRILKGLASKYISIVLAAAIFVSGVPATGVYAATDAYQAVNMSASVQRSDVAAVSKAVAAVKEARRTGSEEDIKKARDLIVALSPIDRLRLYVEFTRDYYLKNYRSKGFKHFNVVKYLAANEDVVLAALKFSPNDIYGYAIKHYLEKGILEGRSSGTDFDPMVAILAKPEIFFEILFSSEKEIPDIIHESFIHVTGKTTTESYVVFRDSLVIIEKYTGNTAYPDGFQPFDNAGNSDGYDDYNDDDPEESEKDFRVPSYVNNKSRNIDPYVLYRDSFENEFFSFTTYNPFDNKNNNKVVNVRFMGENFRRAKELSQGKKYTLMLYFCGTNLETDPYNRSVSGELVSMMQADMSNVNVILCVGGTKEYGSNYINSDAEDGSSFGASRLRSGIYYLNPGALSAIRDRLMRVDTDKGTAMYQLEGTDAGTDKSQGLHFDDIINKDSFIQLVSTSAVDMADPSFLAGFINLSTNLFPAENYGLTLSDHGGGLEDGVIFPDSLDDGSVHLEENGISVDKLESALASTDLYRNKSVSSDGKLGLLFYNACLMASTGLAYNTKDYYRYMVASEETSSGHTSYRYLITELSDYIEQGRSDHDIAIRTAEIYEQYPATHHGFDNCFVGSIAVFSSDDMENTRDNLNELARELSNILGNNANTSSGMKNDVFMAIRKASLACYPTNAANIDDYYINYLDRTKFVDIGELLTHVKYNLNSISRAGYSDKDKKVFDGLMGKLDKTLNSGFLAYLSMYNTEFGGIYQMGDSVSIPLNYTMSIPDGKNIWTDIRTDKNGIRDYLYGSSVYMPLNETVSDFYSSNYYAAYNGSDLNDYVEFIRNYLTYYNDANGYAKKIKNLKIELSGMGSNINRLVSQTSDEGSYLREIVDDGDRTRRFLSFKIADSYEAADLPVPADSTGDPMLDLLETQPFISMVAVHKQKFKANEGALEVNMICAESPVSPFSFALDSKTISFDVTDTTESIISGITLEGSLWNDDKNDWQYVLKSYLEFNSSAKDRATRALFGSDDKSETLTLYGKTLKADNNVVGDTLHFFKKNDNGDYEYCGTVAEDRVDDTYVYEKIDSGSVSAIAAYHYVLQRNDEGNLEKKTLEYLEGIDVGYFAVTDTDNKPYLRTNIPVTQWAGEEQYSGTETGYCIDLRDENEYSKIAYINKDEYDNSYSNVGEGPLKEIDRANTDADEIASVGVFTDMGDRANDSGAPNVSSVGEQTGAVRNDRADDAAEPLRDSDGEMPQDTGLPSDDSLTPIEGVPVPEGVPAPEGAPAPEGNPVPEGNLTPEGAPAPEGDLVPADEPAENEESEPSDAVEPSETGQADDESDESSSEDENTDGE